MIWRLYLYLLLMSLLLSVGHAQELKMITSVESDFSELHVETIRNLYLGREKFVDNKIVEIVENKDIIKLFLDEYIRKDKRTYTGTWRMMVFTGKALAPKLFKDQESLLAYVAQHKNVIGYTTLELKDPKLKVIKVIK